MGGVTGDYAGNHGDTSPGSTGNPTDYYYPGNGTGVINSCRSVRDSAGIVTTDWLDKVSLKDITDGTSNTFLAGEMHFTLGQLNIAPYNGPIFNGDELASHTRIGGPGVPILSGADEPGALFGFGSWHPGICNFNYVDGSARSVTEFLDPVVLGRLCHRSDGRITDLD